MPVIKNIKQALDLQVLPLRTVPFLAKANLQITNSNEVLLPVEVEIMPDSKVPKMDREEVNLVLMLIEVFAVEVVLEEIDKQMAMVFTFSPFIVMQKVHLAGVDVMHGK